MVVVIGIFDIFNKLGIYGENLFYVLYFFEEVEYVLFNKKKKKF